MRIISDEHNLHYAPATDARTGERAGLEPVRRSVLAAAIVLGKAGGVAAAGCGRVAGAAATRSPQRERRLECLAWDTCRNLGAAGGLASTLDPRQLEHPNIVNAFDYDNFGTSVPTLNATQRGNHNHGGRATVERHAGKRSVPDPRSADFTREREGYFEAAESVATLSSRRRIQIALGENSLACASGWYWQPNSRKRRRATLHALPADLLRNGPSGNSQ